MVLNWVWVIGERSIGGFMSCIEWRNSCISELHRIWVTYHPKAALKFGRSQTFELGAKLHFTRIFPKSGLMKEVKFYLKSRDTNIRIIDIGATAEPGNFGNPLKWPLNIRYARKGSGPINFYLWVCFKAHAFRFTFPKFLFWDFPLQNEHMHTCRINLFIFVGENNKNES